MDPNFGGGGAGASMKEKLWYLYRRRSNKVNPIPRPTAAAAAEDHQYYNQVVPTTNALTAASLMTSPISVHLAAPEITTTAGAVDSYGGPVDDEEDNIDTRAAEFISSFRERLRDQRYRFASRCEDDIDEIQALLAALEITDTAGGNTYGGGPVDYEDVDIRAAKFISSFRENRRALL